jgi:hypothetical protein
MWPWLKHLVAFWTTKYDAKICKTTTLLLNILQKQEVLRESACLSKLCSHTYYFKTNIKKLRMLGSWIYHGCVSVMFQILDQINRQLRNLYERYANRILLAFRADVMPCTNMKACATLRGGSSPLLMLGFHPELLQQNFQERHTNCESS